MYHSRENKNIQHYMRSTSNKIFKIFVCNFKLYLDFSFISFNKIKYIEYLRLLNPFF